jgi:hypothetical protein
MSDPKADTTSEPKIDIAKVIMSSIVSIKPQPDNTTEVYLSLSKLFNEIMKIRGNFSVNKIIVDETKVYVYISVPTDLFGDLKILIEDTQTRMTILKKSILAMIGNAGQIGHVKDIIQQNDDGIIVIVINSTVTPTTPGVPNAPTW